LIEERRSVPRYPFSVLAEVIHSSGAEIRAQVIEISVAGCALAAKRTLSVGAEVTIKIHTPADYFQTWAMVVYSNVKGMGLVFHSTAPPFLHVLHKWVTSARSAAATVVNDAY